MKYSKLYFHDLRTVKRRNVRIPSHSHEILRKFNRKVPTPSKKSIRGNMAPGDHTMNVWPPLILVIPLFPLLIRPIIKLLRQYRQNENVFEQFTASDCLTSSTHFSCFACPRTDSIRALLSLYLFPRDDILSEERKQQHIDDLISRCVQTILTTALGIVDICQESAICFWFQFRGTLLIYFTLLVERKGDAKGYLKYSTWNTKDNMQSKPMYKFQFT